MKRKPNVLMKRETDFGFTPTVAGGMLPRARLKSSGVLTYTGMRPYYRRTLRGGAVTVYLRGPGGARGVFVMTAEAAKQIPAGHTYTVEQDFRRKRKAKS